MRDFPDNSVLEPNAPGRLGRLMRRRQKRIAVLALAAKSAGAGRVLARSRNTSLGRSSQTLVRKNMGAVKGESRLTHSASKGIGARDEVLRGSGRTATNGDARKPRFRYSMGRDRRMERAREFAKPSERLSFSTRTSKGLAPHLKATHLMDAGTKNGGRLMSEEGRRERVKKAERNAETSWEQAGVYQRMVSAHSENRSALNPSALKKTRRISPAPVSGTSSWNRQSEHGRGQDEASGREARRAAEYGRTGKLAIGNPAEKARAKSNSAEVSRDKILLDGARDEFRRAKRSLRGGSASLTVNFEPSVIFKGMPDQATKQSLLDALSRHSHELMVIIEQEIAKAKRAEFLA